MEDYRKELEEHIARLKGERETARLGMVKLSLHSKVRLYLELQDKERELSKWIESLELDLELEAMRECNHLFVIDYNREKAIDYRSNIEPLYYCVKCGLYGPLDKVLKPI